jgi:hypothetical protein
MTPARPPLEGTALARLGVGEDEEEIAVAVRRALAYLVHSARTKATYPDLATLRITLTHDPDAGTTLVRATARPKRFTGYLVRQDPQEGSP